MPHRMHKLAEIKHAVERLLATKPDWVTFYREVMGRNGLIRRVYPSSEAMAEFKQTDMYHELHRMLTKLRKKAPPKAVAEDTKVITIRIPQSMHEALRIEAFEHHTTMNKLCISKLVQYITMENIPTEFDERRPAELEEKEAEAGL